MVPFKVKQYAQFYRELANGGLPLFQILPLMAGGVGPALASTFLGTTGHPILGTLAGLGIPLIGLVSGADKTLGSLQGQALFYSGMTGAGLAIPWLSY